MDELLNIRECFSLTFQNLENGGRGEHNIMVNKRNECDGCKISNVKFGKKKGVKALQDIIFVKVLSTDLC